ncbi:MAG: NACHT domain-containing protein, partial [Thermoanaerobaculia bacterium]|nr:NACHT domain-containing protein [Thermoanaerobaculia bacterium]
MIVTFYSFKGGVGRSFSLLETAAQLAQRGSSVVVWDLDLEAPGLQKLPMLTEPLESKLRLGTLDLLLEFEKGGYAKFPERSLRRAVVSLELPSAVAANQGRLDFLLPGRLDESYGKKFGRIDWARLFAPGEALGAAFFLHAAKLLQDQLGYEYVLIDARTGFTDLGAVCTLALPDLVVIVFNLNEQNLVGIERVHLAVTETRRPVSGPVPVLLLANMIPEEPAEVRERKLAELAKRGLRPHVLTPLHPELLLTDALPTLTGPMEMAEDWRPLVDEVEKRRRMLLELAERAEAERQRRPEPREEIEALERREIYEKAKSFEERVAELFRLLGYSATVDYKKDDMQFDIRLELASGPLPTYVLVECKQTARAVTQKEVRELASKVAHARTADQKPYQAILVSQSGFANNAHAVAAQQFVQLLTFEQLLLSLVDLGPSLEAAIAGFRGTALERLYVEQEVVLQSDLEPGKTPRALPLSEMVRDWLEAPTGSFLTLLGDFGSGKTSFCRRLACELAVAARETPGRRAPVLIDLREGASTTVTLESLLTHHFQRLSSRAFNPQALLHLNREGYLVLLFDGFDEILGYAEPSRFLEILRQILRAAEGKAKVILTCRTHYFRDRPDEVKTLRPRPGVLTSEGATRLFDELRERPGAEVGYLREFSQEQIDEYLQKALPPPADWRAFRAQIARTYNLEDLAERPFLLEMIVKTLPRLEGAERVSIADLYEAYCASWFEKNDFRLTMTREVKEALVEHLAKMIWDSSEQHVHFQVLAEKAVEFFRDRPLSVFDKEKVDYEVRTALFLHRNPEGYYAFIHRSFLEFFVARTLRKGLREGDASCLALKRLTREVAFFLSFWPEVEQIPVLAGKVLAVPYQPRISENALMLLVFHARSQVMPLVGPEAEASDEQSLLRAREVFKRLRPGKIHLEGAELEAADLRAIDLSGARLAKARLGRADLRQAFLDASDFLEADLAFADLRGAQLEAATLVETNLDHADARRARFKRADLTSADLSFARLAHTNFCGAGLEACQRFGTGLLGAVGLAEETLLDLSVNLVPQLGHTGSVRTVAWSPDDRLIVSGSNDGSLKLWDAASGALLATFEGHAGGVTSVAWDPQGQRIASASYDNTVKIWNAADARNTHTLQGHEHWVLSVAWDPQGQRIASASYDNTVKIWNAA